MRIPIAAALLAGAFVAPAAADTLDTVKQRGKVICGVSQGVGGFSAPDDQGKGQASTWISAAP